MNPEWIVAGTAIAGFLMNLAGLAFVWRQRAETSQSEGRVKDWADKKFATEPNCHERTERLDKRIDGATERLLRLEDAGRRPARP